MASNTTALAAGATPAVAPAATAAAAADAKPAAAHAPLPADGLVVAETTEAYRHCLSSFLTHKPLMEKESLALKLVPGGQYQLVLSPPGKQQEAYVLDSADWELRPESVDQVVVMGFTVKPPSDTTWDVVKNGEWEGESCPMYAFELKHKGGLKNAILHPNTASGVHKLEPGQHKLIRLGFEFQKEAQEWYSLVAICLGQLDINSLALATLPKALAASKKIASAKESSK